MTEVTARASDWVVGFQGAGPWQARIVMASSPSAAPFLVWLTPALFALLLYGLGQGFMKMWIAEVPPARSWETLSPLQYAAVALVIGARPVTLCAASALDGVRLLRFAPVGRRSDNRQVRLQPRCH
jgi:hypothetical protein